MPRYSISLAYDGGRFHGWQLQPDRYTVQQALEETLQALNGDFVRVYGAGRTDAGVHARGQQAAFTMQNQWEPRRLLLALNAHLPEGVTVLSVRPCPEGFDPRKEAAWRWYRYFIWQSSTCPTYLRPYVWWRKARPWNFESALAGWKTYEGLHDFRAFCKTGEAPDNCTRHLYSLQLHKKGELWVLSVRGQSFLMNMVRSMVGTLDSLCRGCMTPAEFRALLDGAPRNRAGATAPATGLFFWRVGFKGPLG